MEELETMMPLCSSTPAGSPETTGPMILAKGVAAAGAERNEQLKKHEPDIPSTSDQTATAVTTGQKAGPVAIRRTTTVAASTAKIFFSLLLFWLLLAAVAIALFEHDSPWRNTIPALDSVRHALYEPLRLEQKLASTILPLLEEQRRCHTVILDLSAMSKAVLLSPRSACQLLSGHQLDSMMWDVKRTRSVLSPDGR
ncbi:unnamed protein product [Gongylonema pulchrum]|uniref:Uncharacterized protein n=1 Tax=Gongylonema pulchrum TaxID=637853 RepID=A0A3P7RDD9_9BILA|nr:unnamed protein product [Gongylonema pulchrum]